MICVEFSTWSSWIRLKFVSLEYNEIHHFIIFFQSRAKNDYTVSTYNNYLQMKNYGCQRKIEVIPKISKNGGWIKYFSLGSHDVNFNIVFLVR